MPSKGGTHRVKVQQSSKAPWLTVDCSVNAKDDLTAKFALEDSEITLIKDMYP